MGLILAIFGCVLTMFTPLSTTTFLASCISLLQYPYVVIVFVWSNFPYLKHMKCIPSHSRNTRSTLILISVILRACYGAVASPSATGGIKGKTIEWAWIRCLKLSQKQIPTLNFSSASKRAQSTLHFIQSACILDHPGVGDCIVSLGRLHHMKSRTVSNARTQDACSLVDFCSHKQALRARQILHNMRWKSGKHNRGKTTAWRLVQWYLTLKIRCFPTIGRKCIMHKHLHFILYVMITNHTSWLAMDSTTLQLKPCR